MCDFIGIQTNGCVNKTDLILNLLVRDMFEVNFCNQFTLKILKFLEAGNLMFISFVSNNYRLIEPNWTVNLALSQMH